MTKLRPAPLAGTGASLADGDRGSMAVEFVVAVPAFVLLLLLIGFGGQWVSATSEVGAAARDAARQATLEVSYADVPQAAQSVAQGDLGNLCTGNAGTNVQLLENGVKVGPGDWGNGAQVVEVTVTCKVNLRVFSALGIPATQKFSDRADAPLDQFTQRNGG